MVNLDRFLATSRVGRTVVWLSVRSLRGSTWLMKLDAFEFRRSLFRDPSLMKLAASSRATATAGSLSIAEPSLAPCSGCANTLDTAVAGRCRFGVDSEERHLGAGADVEERLDERWLLEDMKSRGREQGESQSTVPLPTARRLTLSGAAVHVADPQ